MNLFFFWETTPTGSWFDILSFIIFCVSIYLGYKSGILQDAIWLLLWAAVLWIGLTEHTLLEPHLQSAIPPVFSKLAASLLTSGLALGVLYPLTHLIRRVILMFGLSIIDKPLGALFGLLRGAFLVVFTWAAISISSAAGQSWFVRSYTHYAVKQLKKDWLGTSTSWFS